MRAYVKKLARFGVPVFCVKNTDTVDKYKKLELLEDVDEITVLIHMNGKMQHLNRIGVVEYRML